MHPLLRYTLDLFESRPEAVAPPDATTRNWVHPQATRQVRLDGVLVSYALIRAKRRSIGMVVGHEGLSVRAPRWTPLYEVDAALQEKARWIVRKLHETHERHVRQSETQIQWQEGTVFPFMGGSLRIVLDPAHNFHGAGAHMETADSAVAGAPCLLRVGLPQSATPAQIRDSVQAWLMRQAKDLFAERLDHFAPLLGVRWTRLSLSNAGTRWGSAGADGAIRLNWRLVHFRPAVIDYVVAHELSHLRVMDHSPRFWDTVRTVVPDYAELRGQLKDDGLPTW